VTPAPRRVVGRLAPSPTGKLHLGNLRTLAAAWLAARGAGGTVWLRIEDLLPGMAGFTAPMVEDLRWAGLDWDPAPGGDAALGGAVVQSERTAVYAAVVSALVEAGLAYACVCTRKDIDSAARAPHAEDVAAAYPGTCRDRFATPDAARAWEAEAARKAGRPPLGVALRLRVDAGRWGFDDLVVGRRELDVRATSGDIVVQRKDGGFAYMIAVVVDDLAMGVTQVVRGDDLLLATGQQLAIYAALAAVGARRAADDGPLASLWRRAAAWQPPTHGHVPLVIGDDGRRLAKRDQSLHLGHVRADGVSPTALRRWLLASLGLPADLDWRGAASRFAWDRLPRGAVRFGARERSALGVDD